uniref:DUF4220 domain-containing protein n=1 Tax=Quercus lobata TaxID=97700 RepID=A0A7N2R0N7_QUELO
MFQRMNWILVPGNNHKENIILSYKDIKKLWDKWNIRSFVLLSLFLQIFLLFTASLRKKTTKKWVTFTIWTAYLLADWAASFAVGLVFDSEEKYNSGPDKVDDTGFLLVLWAPFLLLMVGGQDGITSFAVQDNELWLRHLIWLILQLSTTGFVFIQSVHQNRLWIPTLLLLLAGTIKYSERTIALYLASSDSFGTSVLKEPNPGPDYERLMRTYSHYEASNVPVQFVLSDEKKSQDYLACNVKEGALTDMEYLLYAHRFANMYRGLIVNLMFSSREHGESRNFFSRRDPNETLRILEIELNLFYDLLHTKVVVANSNLGQLVRCISFGLVVAALSLFHKEDKHGLKSFDVRLTYTLFFGVLGLDMVIYLIWMFSDWTIGSCFKSTRYVIRVLKILLQLKKSRWMQSDHRREEIASTPIISKRWSESLSQFNFIEFCCQESGSESEFRIMITKVLKYMHIKDFIEQKKIDIILMCNGSVEPLTRKLWQFIFDELLEKSRHVDDPEEAKRISSARGAWVLEDCYYEYSELMSYVKDVAYDESLLLWHIATELCYNTDEVEHSHIILDCDYYNARKLSKCLSDYMMYLLYQQPVLMSEVSGIAKQRFRDTLAEAQRFFSQRGRRPLAVDCEKILEVGTRFKPAHVKGNISKSALFDASTLAKELKKLGTQKWEVTSKVWVELLSYAASRSRGNGHVQQLSKGGELLTFVWLLMAHLGLRESWVETRIRTKLIVGK